MLEAFKSNEARRSLAHRTRAGLWIPLLEGSFVSPLPPTDGRAYDHDDRTQSDQDQGAGVVELVSMPGSVRFATVSGSDFLDKR